MDLCLITIGGIKFCAAEIDLLHLLMEDDDPHWTVLEISNSLPYDVSDTWEYTQSLILSGIIERADMSQSCLLYTSPSPRDRQKSRMPSSA